MLGGGGGKYDYSMIKLGYIIDEMERCFNPLHGNMFLNTNLIWNNYFLVGLLS
jgi:hypothetical protein